MTYIQFFTTDAGGQPVEMIASDSVHPVDGRLSIRSAIMRGARQARSLRGVGKNITGMKVMKGGSYSTAWAVTGLIPINDTNTKGA